MLAISQIVRREGEVRIVKIAKINDDSVLSSKTFNCISLCVILTNLHQCYGWSSPLAKAMGRRTTRSTLSQDTDLKEE